MNILDIQKYLTLKPFDTGTEQGRSDERYRLAALTVTANVFSRGMAMLVMVLSVSLTIPYLGAERFGVWMTIASFAGMLSFLDLGVGNALTNRVSYIETNKDNESLQNTISGGIGFLLIIGLLAGTILYFFTDIIPWERLIKLDNEPTYKEIQEAVKIFSIIFGISLVTSGVQKIFAGLQISYIAHIVSLLGSIVTIPCLYIATQQIFNVSELLIVTFGIQQTINLLLIYILKQKKLIRIKNIKLNTGDEYKILIKTGGLFLVLQIGTMVCWGLDSFIISSTLGAASVATYSVVQRLFQFVSQPLSMINAPFWAAYANANYIGDKQFIRKSLKKSLISTFIISTILGFILLCSANMIIKHWTNENINPTIMLLVVFFSWTVIETVGNAFAMFLNGCGIVKEQVVTVITLSILVLPAKLYSAKNWGAEEMLIIYIFMYLSIVFVFYGCIFKKSIMEKLKL